MTPDPTHSPTPRTEATPSPEQKMREAINDAIDCTNNPPYFDKLPKWSEARGELVHRLLQNISRLQSSGCLKAEGATHWAAKKALRLAFVKTIEGLYPLTKTNYGNEAKYKSQQHLAWMCEELLRKMDDFPHDKTSRWIGFIQGVLCAKGLLDVEQERNRTRPWFTRAYEMARSLPPTSHQPAPSDTK